MKVVRVAVLAKGIPYEELSYFSKEGLTSGDLVEIQVRRRNCRGLVVDSQEVKEERVTLRKSSFGLKKISKVIKKQFLHPKIWNSFSYMSSYLLKPAGEIIHELLPEKAVENLAPISIPSGTKGFELLLLEQNLENRMTRYKTLIRESFSKKKSLVIFFPTITDLEYATSELAKGIDEYVVTLHSGLGEKQWKEFQKEIANNIHPLLILSTPSILPWVRKDLGLIVLEREHSHYYYTFGERGYDMRFVIEQLAKGSGVPCLLGSHMLSLRAHMLYKQRDAHEIMPIQYRNDTSVEVVSMQENKSVSPYLSRKTLSLLHESSLSKEGHYFLYAQRKGMYPTTICSDCSTLFVCNKCLRPYVLHKISGKRTYVCHECENTIEINEDTSISCKHCGGWRMMTLGVATSGVEEELKRLGLPIFVIDSERTSTKTKVKKVYKEWEDAPYGILVGTEMAHNIVKKCDGIIILSLDSLFSLPEYKTDEKILNLVTEMAEKIKGGEGKIILQTRLKNMPVMKQLVSPSLREVYDTLLKEREKFLLPPKYIVIKSSFESLPNAFKIRLEQELDPYTVEWFEQGKNTLLFLHIKESEWANTPSLRERIKKIIYHSRPLVNPLYFFV